MRRHGSLRRRGCVAPNGRSRRQGRADGRPVGQDVEPPAGHEWRQRRQGEQAHQRQEPDEVPRRRRRPAEGDGRDERDGEQQRRPAGRVDQSRRRRQGGHARADRQGRQEQRRCDCGGHYRPSRLGLFDQLCEAIQVVRRQVLVRQIQQRGNRLLGRVLEERLQHPPKGRSGGLVARVGRGVDVLAPLVGVRQVPLVFQNAK